jgi:hypothetical protein
MSTINQDFGSADHGFTTSERWATRSLASAAVDFDPYNEIDSPFDYKIRTGHDGS